MNTWIEKAREILKANNIVANYSGFSDAHGISVYFTSSEGKKVRVSTHSVTNIDRMANEVLLYFKLPKMPKP